jgi:L-ascorbate metabolism protein UlaG (beta-lactamase superfamily)
MIACLAIVKPLSSGSEGTNQDTGTVRITYIGNEGFLIEVGARKVLVDALYRDGVSGYVVIPAARRKQMESASPPFDDVDVVLTTHYHADHFDAAAVGAHLVSNPNALFVSTNQVGEEMRSLSDFQRYADRVRTIVPEEGRRANVQHSGVRIEVLNLHHGRDRPIENLGFLFEVGGVRMLHIGDTEADAAEFRRNQLHEARIDIAFVPYWYLAYEGMAEAVRDGIQAERIVAMHVPPKELKESYLDDLGGFDKAKKQILETFSNAVIFEEEMESKSFTISHSPPHQPKRAR